MAPENVAVIWMDGLVVVEWGLIMGLAFLVLVRVVLFAVTMTRLTQSVWLCFGDCYFWGLSRRLNGKLTLQFWGSFCKVRTNQFKTHEIQY